MTRRVPPEGVGYYADDQITPTEIMAREDVALIAAAEWAPITRDTILAVCVDTARQAMEPGDTLDLNITGKVRRGSPPGVKRSLDLMRVHMTVTRLIIVRRDTGEQFDRGTLGHRQMPGRFSDRRS